MCSPVWSGTHCVAQAGLELTEFYLPVPRGCCGLGVAATPVTGLIFYARGKAVRATDTEDIAEVAGTCT